MSSLKNLINGFARSFLNLGDYRHKINYKAESSANVLIKNMIDRLLWVFLNPGARVGGLQGHTINNK
jgi:hypothetical protein